MTLTAEDLIDYCREREDNLLRLRNVAADYVAAHDAYVGALQRREDPRDALKEVESVVWRLEVSLKNERDNTDHTLTKSRAAKGKR